MSFSSKTFCPLPWINISSDTDGSVRLCCVSNEFISKPSGEKYNLGYDKLNDIINSTAYKEVRKNMLNGIEIKGCERCYDVEKHNGISYRQQYLNHYKNFDILLNKVNQSMTGDIDPTVQYYDLRYGNLCNLSCRSCYPGASSQLDKDVRELENTTNIIEFHSHSNQDLNSWYETDTFKQNVESQLQNLTDYYATGGEPTINQKNYEVLLKMIDTGDSKHCNLKLNTNLTNTKQDFYSIFKYFRSVNLMASIDGYGNMQEYLRYPSNWLVIANNINKLLHQPNVKFSLSPVIQITNLGYITDLFDYVEKINATYDKCLINLHPIVLKQPDYLNLINLPKSYKIQCYEKIETWITYHCKYQSNIFHTTMNEVKNKCNSEVDYKVHLDKFFEFNDIFDKHRNQRLIDVNPELNALRP